MNTAEPITRKFVCLTCGATDQAAECISGPVHRTPRRMLPGDFDRYMQSRRPVDKTAAAERRAVIRASRAALGGSLAAIADPDAELASLNEQMHDALARRKALPSWKVDMPEDTRRVRSALARELNDIRSTIQEIGRTCPDCPSGRVRTHRESYYDMDRCDSCRYSAVVYALGD
jgi:hypothetical protein